MQTNILREGTSSCPISSSGSEGVPTLSPPCTPYRQRRPRRLWSAAYSWPDSRFSGLCLNLTVWFSYHVVSFSLHTCRTRQPRRTTIPCLLITTWRLVKAHGVTWTEPKIHVIYYITSYHAGVRRFLWFLGESPIYLNLQFLQAIK